MTRNENEREDLMRDATALVERIKLPVSEALARPVVAGFRRDSSLSLYFGEDPVYQFDNEGRLRRAFVDGRIYRTQGSVLAELTRVRSDAETILCRRDLAGEQLDLFFRNMLLQIAALREALLRESSLVRGVLAEEPPLLERLSKRVDQLLSQPAALAPAINQNR